MEENLIAPCGMNCSLCISYLSMKNEINKNGFNKKYCQGCIPRGKNCTFMKDQCEMIGNGEYRFCYECKDFPCTRLKSLDKRYSNKYHMSMIENLKYIQENSIESFLVNEKEKWTCIHCGEIICCHNGLCLSCELDKLKNNKKYNWEQ